MKWKARAKIRGDIFRANVLLAAWTRESRRLFLSSLCAVFVVFTVAEIRGEDLQPTPTAAEEMQPATPTEETEKNQALSEEVPAAGSTAGPQTPFKKMTLDELLNVPVTSVSRGISTIGQSAAAITVITQEDIRRSGVTNIAEALRMAPGMEVARIDNSTWAISARGFNNSAANKLLVLIDGRSVYSPLFSGVFWDVQDTLMQDIDRIEVIRGSAGTLWGANAVNGVINVITKDAKDTQGLLVMSGGGSEELNFENVRYGWKINEEAFARVYVKHFERDATVFTNGRDGRDDFYMTQGGYRVDWEPSLDNHFTFQGDLYQGTRDNLNNDDTDLMGGNMLARWTHELEQGGDVKLQMYYDRTDRDIPRTFNEGRDTFDLDFQHHFPLGTWNDITWGLGYRVTSVEIGNSSVLRFAPEHRHQQLASIFVQDEIQVIRDRLRLTLGTKLEHNDSTGIEIQPNARLLWTIDTHQTAWAAVSRAVRTPTQLEQDLQIVVPPVGAIFGNPHFQSEEVLAYELGYRVEPLNWLALDIAMFYNIYDNLRSIERVNRTTFVEDNKLNGKTYGIEVGATVKPTDWWTIRSAYTYLEVRLDTDSDSTDATSEASEDDDPHNQVYVRSSMDLPQNLQLDCTLRYVNTLKNQRMPDYLTSDVRLAWKPIKQMEVAIVGQNLLDNQHPEFGVGVSRHEIQRSVYGTVTFWW